MLSKKDLTPDAEDYPSDYVFAVADGTMCNGEGCFHFIKDRDDERVYRVNGLDYCEDCFYSYGLMPSDAFWEPSNAENWRVDDEDAYYGDDEA